MKKKSDITTFADVQAFLNSFTFINCGGCGISALAMYRWLKKHNQLPESVRFCFLDNDEDLYQNNQRYFQNKDVELLVSSHVVLVLDGIAIDSNGVFDAIRLRRYPYKTVADEQFLIHMLNNVGNWNKAFDRKEIAPKIAETLGVDFSDIKMKVPFWDF